MTIVVDDDIESTSIICSSNNEEVESNTGIDNNIDFPSYCPLGPPPPFFIILCFCENAVTIFFAIFNRETQLRI